MNCVLITGGEIPEFQSVSSFIKGSVYVADSGFDWVVENSVKYDCVVGDFDSVKNITALHSVCSDKIVRLPSEKDDTDTLYALKLIKEMNFSSVTLIGGGGGRLDHLLGIFSLFESELSPDIWITAKEIVYKVKGYFSLEKLQCKTISVYPLNKVVCSIKSNGLKWNLNTVDWKFKSIGISNQVETNDAWIDSGDNDVLIIIPITGKGFE